MTYFFPAEAPISRRPTDVIPTHLVPERIQIPLSMEEKLIPLKYLVLLPPSALDHLTRLNVQYPMLFKLSNKKASRHTHCGVLEFVADEGMCYVPYWMLRNLQLEEGDMVHVKSVALPVATFAKFQPQDESFLDIFNPKAVLENALRDFACLTVDDMIAIKYNDQIYELKVLAVEPAEAVSIIECDMSVDFAPPVGYVEKRMENQKKAVAATNKDVNENLIPAQSQGFQIFGGSGIRLDGRSCDPSTSGSTSAPGGSRITQRGVPNYEYKPGSLTFLRMGNKVTTEDVSAFLFSTSFGKLNLAERQLSEPLNPASNWWVLHL
ncbi:unnamed protein product [Dibothriocephalus latus]|uniref:Ubiquitin fusion degradation protein UFD1 n=1 Tax=Dibothriocephalus latus TaxID=60516 RepID=A0A3P7L3J8_DIBLA|nr:unnamed protein product [Dibothriocephalus latus]